VQLRDIVFMETQTTTVVKWRHSCWITQKRWLRSCRSPRFSG